MPLSNSQRPLYEVKAGLFKGLAHPIRIHILELLCDGREHTVADIQEHTGLEASHLSQHLAVLRRHGVVVSDRRASHVYYKVASDEVIALLGSARRFLVDVLHAQSVQLSEVAELPTLPRKVG
ncbi:ArsR/SmtB family transcription factor [Tessaracoccus caeni]|uniref:ArsR/SmtB family transcription factor n=1 Tax=Tessaracoccus caeni TaxID=3031239 RepID=UPI0023DB0487|nr:metalloregulator ArsR/SmtB family transcription factor [Tessaracoccus caeni]MDF1486989.1 metalloregulator ArsR/SmtB family transcription factor [Tessaracoccus caeni]